MRLAASLVFDAAQGLWSGQQSCVFLPAGDAEDWILISAFRTLHSTGADIRASNTSGTTERHNARAHEGCAPSPARPHLGESLLSLHLPRRLGGAAAVSRWWWCVAVLVRVCVVWWAVLSLPSRTLHGALSECVLSCPGGSGVRAF